MSTIDLVWSIIIIVATTIIIIVYMKLVKDEIKRCVEIEHMYENLILLDSDDEDAEANISRVRKTRTISEIAMTFNSNSNLDEGCDSDA